MSLQSLWQQSQKVVRDFGLGTLCHLLLLRLLNVLLHFDVLIVVLVGREHVICPESPDEADLSFKVLRARDYHLLLREVAPDIRQRFHLDSFDADADPEDLLLVSYVKTALAGFTFAHLGATPTLATGLRLRAPQGYAYTFAAFTVPEFRGRKHQGRRHYELLHSPECINCAGLISYVNFTNLESRRGLTKSGYRPVGKLCHASLERLQLTWSGTRLKRAGVPLDSGRTWSLSWLDRDHRSGSMSHEVAEKV